MKITKFNRLVIYFSSLALLGVAFFWCASSFVDSTELISLGLTLIIVGSLGLLIMPNIDDFKEDKKVIE